MNVGVERNDGDVGRNVHPADDHQNIWIFHGNLLGNLHHHEDDYQVGTMPSISLLRVTKYGGFRTFED